MFYIYEWYIVNTNEIFYVGKGTKKRYLCKQHNQVFKHYINKYNCASRILKYFDKEEDAFKAEYDRIKELKMQGQAVCNLRAGGSGGETASWTPEKRTLYSKNNVMKSEQQRQRMRENNPMKNPIYAKRNGIKHSKAVNINGKIYSSGREVAKIYNVTPECVRYWLKRGYTNKNEPCNYVKTISSQASGKSINCTEEGSTTNG